MDSQLALDYLFVAVVVVDEDIVGVGESFAVVVAPVVASEEIGEQRGADKQHPSRMMEEYRAEP